MILLLSFFLIAKVQSNLLSPRTIPEPQIVEVSVEGWVEKPGVYKISLGTPYREILRSIKPKRFANLREIDQNARLKESVKFCIEQLQEIIVTINGAVVHSGPLSLPAGTRICDLRKILSLSQDADLAFFKKRRILSDQEVIVIPEKLIK